MQEFRYADKPMDWLLERYVLWCIGCLGQEQQEALVAIEPKLSGLFGRSGAWHEILRLEMELPETFPEAMRRGYGENCRLARGKGLLLPPEEFARQVVIKYLVS